MGVVASSGAELYRPMIRAVTVPTPSIEPSSTWPAFTAATPSGVPVATVAVDAMEFHRPVRVGDVVSFYATVERIGTTSLTVRINAEAMSEATGEVVPVTEGQFVYVALDAEGRPTKVDAGQ